MSVFGRYARYYDVLYAGKDYAGECDFIEAAFARFSDRPQTVLDLACGTGGHGLILAERGYQVCGVDRAPEMLDCFREKAAERGLQAEVHTQDLRELRLDRSFDAAVCMFDAVGYLTDEGELAAFFRAVRSHVRPGGLFLFDVWHAAPVLRAHDPVRVREHETPEGRLLRVSTTELDLARQVANVSFHVIALSGDRVVDEFTELHRVRFFLAGELQFMLQSAGWEVLGVCPAFDLDGPVTGETWHLVGIARSVQEVA